MHDRVDENFASVNLGSNPAFGLDDEKSLHPAACFNTLAGRRHLIARIARDPLDLRAHLQRLSLALDAGTEEPAEMIFAALLDLFLALGDKGRELRAAVLNMARSQLPHTDYSFLAQHLGNGLQRMDVLPMTTGSILDRSVFGNSRLVERQRAEAEAGAGAEALNPDHALDMAAMHLENGDLNSAVAVLEAALLSDFTNAAVAADLLEIYRRSRDTARFLAMKQRLEKMGLSLAAEWNEL
jgi:hypothetical protein